MFISRRPGGSSHLADDGVLLESVRGRTLYVMTIDDGSAIFYIVYSLYAK